jgi:Mlc titration factor MtfA (ptsG expression regulator)
LDGVPELLLERKLIPKWQQLVQSEMERIRRGESGIDAYGATSPIEFFAVVSEYFFEQPDVFATHYPELNEMLTKTFIRK